jgi:NitT/TauT family transport system ATP-binding protein
VPTIALRVNGIDKAFVASDGARVHALDSVSLDVLEGEFVSLIGPSGCGKSTLFQIIGGLLASDAGTVRVEDRPIDGSHRDIGMVFQEESTFPWRTVLQNVAFPLELAGLPQVEREAKARRFIRLVGLDGFEHRYPDELSGGMRQRTAIARTLAFEPRILLMDEPFASLDEQTRILLGDKILQIWRELRQTTLLITHNITEAVQLSDRVVVMTYRPGRIKRIVDIDLPRPRDSQLIATAEFGRYVGILWQDLREEASRGMAEADKIADTKQ